MGTGEKFQMNIKKLIIHQKSFREDSHQILCINDYKFCITFLGHLYLWKHGRKPQMNTSKLILYQQDFREDFNKIRLYE